MDLKTLQVNLPWSDNYNTDFRSNPQLHKDFQHALLHISKAAGKLNSLIDDAEHKSCEFTKEQTDPYIADLVICALRMANTIPGRTMDLEQAVIDRLESKNNIKLPKTYSSTSLDQTFIVSDQKLTEEYRIGQVYKYCSYYYKIISIFEGLVEVEIYLPSKNKYEEDYLTNNVYSLSDFDNTVNKSLVKNSVILSSISSKLNDSWFEKSGIYSCYDKFKNEVIYFEVLNYCKTTKIVEVNILNKKNNHFEIKNSKYTQQLHIDYVEHNLKQYINYQIK